MRKQNSEFQMAFLTHEGMQLLNHDDFGSVELDKFACYIIVDGIETSDDAESARLARDAAALAFTSHPSMSRSAVASYVKSAHRALTQNRDDVRMKASITVVVTDYAKLRYGYAGNTRFTLFRSNQPIVQSADHSLAQQLVNQSEIAQDKVAKHEQRGNLSRYLGQDGALTPQVSKKLKLKDGDIAALYTRGIWENCDTHDMAAALQEAGKEPQKATELTERLILSAHPDELDNYTLALIFINKVFVDPNKKKKLKTILMIAIPLLVVAIIFGIIFYFRWQKRQENRRSMEFSLLSGIEYIQDDNYIKAKDELQAAYELSVTLKDNASMTEISGYQKLVEAVINADELLSGEDYETAVQGYLRAKERSKYTDNLGQNYINLRLRTATGFINVQDFINLGDTLTDQGSYTMAEEKYLSARSLAAEIYYAEGKQQAIDALNTLYEKMNDEVTQAKESSKTEISASEFVVQGNTAFQSNDFVSAQMYYTMAKEKYDELGDEKQSAAMDEKLRLIEEKQQENAEKAKKAAIYISNGEALQEDGEYADAKKQYIFAREIYAALGNEDELADVKAKIEIVDGFLTSGS